MLVILRRLLLLLLRAFPRFLPEEPVGGYTEVHKAWQAQTFLEQALAKTVALGVRCDGLRRRGVWRNLGKRFSACGGRWKL